MIGFEADIRNLERRDIQELFERYYTPDRIIIGIAGDVDAKQVQPMAEAYFGRFKAQSRAPNVVVNLPPQTEPRQVSVTLPSEPWYMEGYQRPALTDPDDAVYQMISSILSGGSHRKAVSLAG